MKYQIIFTNGLPDNNVGILNQKSDDVLLLNENGDYYRPYFVTLEAINKELEERNCFFTNCLVVVYAITKDIILQSVSVLHRWHFYKGWLPLSNEEMANTFSSKERWVTYTVDVKD